MQNLFRSLLSHPDGMFDRLYCALNGHRWSPWDDGAFGPTESCDRCHACREKVTR